ncbi:MAG: ribbon-helix-helix domain-containing protein [Lentisphaeraceae bacterium]|nr:ribbon-helix-helix domain-containing protein [Lentisphaeraceae bacterium]
MKTKDSIKTQPSKKQMVATSLRIEKKLLSSLDDYGQGIERSRNWVVNKILSRELKNMGLM